MRGSLKIGNIFGIGLFIHWTFSILLFIIIITNYRAGHSPEQIGWSVVFILSIFVTVFLHELGHSLAARRKGIKTKDITLLPIGGVARLEAIPEKPLDELFVALAGPAVNIVLAAITYFFLPADFINVNTMQMSAGVNAENFIAYFFFANIWLAVFNLIPAFPMDGGRVLRAIMAMHISRDRATFWAARIGQVLAFAFILLGIFSNPFLVFIGLFIIIGAQAEYENTRIQFSLKGYKVSDVVMKNYEVLEPDSAISEAVDKLLNGSCKSFLIMSNSTVVGTITKDDLILALQQHKETEKVCAFMNKEFTTIHLDAKLEDAMKTAQQTKQGYMPVMDDKRHVTGVLDLENILEFVMIIDAKNKYKTHEQ